MYYCCVFMTKSDPKGNHAQYNMQLKKYYIINK